MRFNDAVIGVLLLAFAMAIFAYARTLPAIPGQEYGAGAFPTLVALGLGGCGVQLLVSGVRGWHGAVSWNAWARSHHAWAKLITVFVLMLTYIGAAHSVGFVPMSVFLLLVFFLLMGVRWWVAVPVALVATMLIQQTFANLLRVPLPLGLLAP